MSDSLNVELVLSKMKEPTVCSMRGHATVIFDGYKCPFCEQLEITIETQKDLERAQSDLEDDSSSHQDEIEGWEDKVKHLERKIEKLEEKLEEIKEITGL